MITANLADAFLDVVEGIISFVIGLVPDLEVPSWFTAGSSTLVDWASYAAPMSQWVPFTVIIGVLGTVLTVWGLMALFSLVLKIYAMVRGGAS